MGVLPFLAMCFMVLEGYVYTIAAYFYAFRLAFSSILHCVLHHFPLRFAPKRTAFCTKTHCILHQNALHLAAYCTAFCTILHYFSLQIAPKQVQMADTCNKYSLCRTHKLTPFCIKTNSRENRFFGARRAVGGEKGQP